MSNEKDKMNTKIGNSEFWGARAPRAHFLAPRRKENEMQILRTSSARERSGAREARALPGEIVPRELLQ